MRKRIQLGQPLATLVALVMLGVTFLVWKNETTELNKKRAVEFEAASSQIASNVQERLSNFELILKGTKGFYEGSDNVTREEFHSFFGSFSLDPTRPGLQSVAIALRVPAQELPAHVAAQQKSGLSAYAVQPQQARQQYVPLTLIEPPTETNTALLGFDVASNPVMLEALELARDAGQMSVSGRIQTDQNGSGAATTVAMYVPIFTKNTDLGTVDGRREGVAGWVSGSFRVSDLMASLQGQIDPNVGVKIYQSSTSANSDLLYDHHPGAWHDAVNSAQQTTKVIALGSKQWSLRMSATSKP